MNPDEDNKPIEKDVAVEIALLMSALAASGRKGGDEYKKAFVETFTQMLDGFGYEVTAKSGSEA